MKKSILIIYFVFLTLISYGQNHRVIGTIVADTSVIKVGQIALFSAVDSTLKKGSYLESTFFSINLKAKDNKKFYLKIAVPEYIDTLISFEFTDTLKDLGQIVLMKDNNLEAVSVVYQKEMFTRTMDGVSVSVDGTSLQNLTNLFEVLKASPRITSPDDERIEIIGRGSPLILVDRQAIISNDELRAIPAAQIDRIEIITNPSAKYRAQGGSGVIEVYTKNFHLEGYNITLRASFGESTQLRPAANGSLGLSLKKKKFSLNGYLGGNLTARNGYSDSKGITTDDSDRSLVNHLDSDNKYIWQYFSVKAAYNISEKQRFTMGVNGYGSDGGNENRTTQKFFIEDDLLTKSTELSSSDWTWLNNSAFINYTIETDTNRSNFEINLNYVNKISLSNTESRSTFENILSATESQFDVKNEEKDIPNIGELRINYEHIFDTTGWKLGVGGAYSALFNKKKFEQFSNVDNEWTVDPVYSNSYDYQEHIGAAFIELSKKWKKIGFRAGIRAEYTKLDGYSNSLNKQFMDSSFILPFPTMSILYEPYEKLGITFFYDSGIERPQFSNYDPFVRVTDSLSIQYGNPFLRPAIEQSFGIDIDFLYMYNFSVSYSHVKDPASTISFIQENSFLTESTPWNAKNEQGISASLSIPLQAKWIRGWNSLWIDYSKYTFTPEFGREPFFNVTYGFYSYLTFLLPKDFSIQNRFHVNKWGGENFANKVNANWGLRLTKKFNGNKFQLFADVANIIPMKSRRNMYSGNFEYSSISRNEFTTFSIGFYVKFGRLRRDTQIEESKSGQSDRL